VAAGPQDVSLKEIKECFRIYLTLYDERIALVDGLADILVGYGANTITECAERMSGDDKHGQKVLHDFDQLPSDAREAERRLGRQPKQAYTLEEVPMT
jgi:hypothetical protein